MQMRQNVSKKVKSVIRITEADEVFQMYCHGGAETECWTLGPESGVQAWLWAWLFCKCEELEILAKNGYDNSLVAWWLRGKVESCESRGRGSNPERDTAFWQLNLTCLRSRELWEMMSMESGWLWGKEEDPGQAGQGSNPSKWISFICNQIGFCYEVLPKGESLQP